MSNKVFGALIVVALALIIAASSLFIILETERGVLLRLGALKNEDLSTGLHVKVPFIDRVVVFDGRLQTLDAPAESFFTIENKRLIVDSYVKWRVSNTSQYYKATGGLRDIAQQRISSRVADGLRNKFGTRTVQEVVSGQRDELMEEISKEIDQLVAADLGIEVVDIRVKRIDLPDDVSGSVYDRMRAAREEEAREHRFMGEERAIGIRAGADKQATVIEAEAYRDAEKIRGEGDARAANIYANAYSKDPEFYAFVRSLTAYREAFGNNQDVLLLDPDSEFFRYLKDAEGKP